MSCGVYEMRLARGHAGGEWIGFGFYQFCGNMGSIGRVFVLQWFRW